LPRFGGGHRFGTALGALNEGIEVVLLSSASPRKLIVNIEMFVFRVHSFFEKKPLKSMGSISSGL